MADLKKTMKIALFGTCRIGSFRRHFECTDFDEAISYVHSTKEIIQLIKYITKQIEIPDTLNQFCFRAGILKRQPVSYADRFLSQFHEADLFVIEICAIKKYMYQGYYLHHLAVDKRLHYYKDTPQRIVDGTTVQHQAREEIEKDLSEIMELAHPRKILLVSHINATIDVPRSRLQIAYDRVAGMTRRALSRVLPVAQQDEMQPQVTAIGKRIDLISLLRTIAQEKGIAFFDPTVVLAEYPQKEILESESPGLPPGHYTELGEKAMGLLYAGEIKRIMK